MIKKIEKVKKCLQISILEISNLQSILLSFSDFLMTFLPSDTSLMQAS
jgi:hypothetical protein